eukprot:Rhum_TRINITY_DN14505_c10_g1::Rhum_TRINITY_DN14505_c10_g1_i1::g.98013::m.98013/K15371/GDH2; glutamate dehydrogenase
MSGMQFTIRSSTEKDKLQERAKPLVRGELGPLGDAEVEWFCGNLGLSRRYFASVDEQDIAKHAMLLFAAKFRARIADSSLDLDISDERKHSAIYICPSRDTADPRVAQESASATVERRIQAKYLDEAWHSMHADTDAGQAAEASKAGQLQTKGGSEEPCEGFVVEAFRSSGEVARTMPTKLRLFVVQRPKYPEAKQGEAGSLHALACTQFLNFIAPQHFPDYGALLKRAESSNGCVVTVTTPSEDEWSEHSMHNEEHDVVVRVAHKRGTTHSFYSSSSQLYRMHGFRSRVKAMWPFRNRIDVQTIWLSPMEPISYAELQKRVASLNHHITLSYILPSTPFTSLVSNRQLGAGEHAYAYCGLIFAHHFLTLSPNETDSTASYKASLLPEIDSAPASAGIKKRLRQNMLTEGRLAEAVLRYPELVQKLHAAFEKLHAPWTPMAERHDPQAEEEIAKMILRTVPNEINQRVLLSLLDFNKFVLKTNFFKEDRNVLAFRLDPKVMDNSDYPEVPYGIFLVVGSVFRGFHIRFRDVARGGIRLIRSGNEQAYANNVATLLEENYALAHTQQRKNKDIPEGGSKGTILLAPGHQDKGHVAFDQYIDGMLDLILPSKTMKDYLGTPEMLFFGPDEGTADKMDRAAQRAKQRGYSLWKASTTGKSIMMGGIPHDTYGMTTRSVHQNVLGVLETQGVREEDITKFQTGGPDGDLGSNEILISKDKTMAIVDGSGVVYDPEGLNRTELNRLATERLMIDSFDSALLSSTGYKVLVTDKDVTLPNGRVVESGLLFRNEYHLNRDIEADLFVPCGGRPDSVNINNVSQMFKEDEVTPRFKYIVEGANLFITRDARRVLEDAGVILMKDATCNKGGVTSSSLEVLASLAMTGEQHAELMCVKGDKVPEFYKNYVIGVQEVIERNARMEFKACWRERQSGKYKYMIEITDLLSKKINSVNDQLQASGMLDRNERLKRVILEQALPPTLLEVVSMDEMLERVPDNYLNAICGCYFAAHYVYKYGLQGSEVQILDFIQEFVKLEA